MYKRKRENDEIEGLHKITVRHSPGGGGVCCLQLRSHT